MVVTRNAEVLRFRASEVALYGTNASGVKSILVKPKDKVVDAFYTNQTEDILFFTSRNYFKRMKVSEFALARIARAGSSAIKMIKANPHYIVGAKPMTPMQYRENVKANLIYKNGNQAEEVKEFKYNVSDAGKNVDKNEGLVEPVTLFIDKANGKEPVINGAYLMEAKTVQTTIFDSEIEGTQSEEISTTSILDDLDAFLSKESIKFDATVLPTENKKEPKIVEKKAKEKKGIFFKKVNLFGEEE